MPRDPRSRKRIILYRAEVLGDPEIYEVQYASVADALHFACRDLRSGRRNPLEIIEEGVLVYDASRIREECERDQVETEQRLGIADEEAEPAKGDEG